MAKHSKRKLPPVEPDTLGIYAIGNIAQNLVDRLNGEERDPDPEFEQIRELVRNLNALDGLVRQKGFPRTTQDLLDLGVDDVQMRKALQRQGFDRRAIPLVKKVRSAFASFKLAVRPVFPLENGWKFFLVHPGARSHNPKSFLNMDLGWVHELAANGRLRMVRECTDCKKWYLARREDQRFCSSNCRERDYRVSDRGKAKRAAFMRGYRDRLKRRDEAIARLARK
jgi:hypothetical protein